MPVTVIVGTQWGDEGKGKIVDFMAPQANIVARYQGGNNAGHTIVIQGEQFITHTVPSGVFSKDIMNVIGNGVVIDLKGLIEEIGELEDRGVQIDDNLIIAENAHVIMPYHKTLDALREDAKGAQKLGTTKRGIAYAYSDKYYRRGIRIGDFMNPVGLKNLLEDNLDFYNFVFRDYYKSETLDFESIFNEYLCLFDRVKDMLVDASVYLNTELKKGKNLLCEGAQGTLLDVDFGTYPYVTSSNPISGAVCTGLGIPPTAVTKCFGIVKAYTTRVGAGPFPCELTGELGDRLREIGAEYGATTGRPRRCGWFDATVVRRAVMLSGITNVAITKLDVLDQFDKIKVCTNYIINGKRVNEFPLSIHTLNNAKAVYEELDGWQSDTTNITDYDKLPENAKTYLKRIEELIEAKISIISVGPERNQTILLDTEAF